MSVYLISDLHLSPKEPKLTEKFFYFLENYAKKAEALYGRAESRVVTTATIGSGLSATPSAIGRE